MIADSSETVVDCGGSEFELPLRRDSILRIGWGEGGAAG